MKTAPSWLWAEHPKPDAGRVGPVSDRSLWTWAAGDGVSRGCPVGDRTYWMGVPTREPRDTSEI